MSEKLPPETIKTIKDKMEKYTTKDLQKYLENMSDIPYIVYDYAQNLREIYEITDTILKYRLIQDSIKNITTSGETN